MQSYWDIVGSHPTPPTPTEEEEDDLDPGTVTHPPPLPSNRLDRLGTLVSHSAPTEGRCE